MSSSEPIETVFNKEMPRQPIYFLMQVKKLFAEVAPNATQEQKDLLNKLNVSIMSANSLIETKIRNKARSCIQGLNEATKNISETKDKIQIDFTKADNQRQFFRGMIDTKTEKLAGYKRELSELEEKLVNGQKTKDELEKLNDKMRAYYKQKDDEARMDHEQKMNELQMELSELKMEKFIN